MALSSVSYLGDGSNKLFSITFPYLSKSHVKVLVNGVEDTTFTWVTTGSINTTNTPVAGSIVVIKRETPTAPLVDFVDGSTLTEKLLDMSTAQSLFVAEESNDSITQLMQVDLNDNKFDGLNKAVKNVADPVNPQDVATKAWSEAAYNGAVATTSANAVIATTKASEASISASNALISENTSEVASALASKWAEESEDIPVEAGKFSAKHWAIKAELAGGDKLSTTGGTLSGLLKLAVGTTLEASSTVDLSTATGNTLSITGTIAITAFTMTAGQQMELIAEGAIPLIYNATTMNINGGVSYTCAAGDRLSVTKDGAGVVRVNVTKQDGTPIAGGGGSTSKIFDIDATVAGNDLTITVNNGVWVFRSTTLTDGTPVTRTLSSPVSLVIPNGATLGSVNAISSRYVVGLLDNAGTLEPFAINIAGGNQLDETNLITTTTISTGADSNNVAYSTTGRTSKAYRIIGFIDITEATAGTYATAPTLVQGCGGQALAALSSLGYGQTWQDVTGSRVSGTTYYNATGKPIHVRVQNSTSGGIAVVVNGVTICSSGATITGCADFIVPPNNSYSATFTSSSLHYWAELR